MRKPLPLLLLALTGCAHVAPAVRDRMGADEWESMATGFVERAIDKGVDTFTTLYHGCQRHMCRYEAGYPVKVEHYLTVIGRALGIEHEDLHKKHVLSGDVDAIMEETSPRAIASSSAGGGCLACAMKLQLHHLV